MYSTVVILPAHPSCLTQDGICAVFKPLRGCLKQMFHFTFATDWSLLGCHRLLVCKVCVDLTAGGFLPAEELQLFEMHRIFQPYSQVSVENLLLSDGAVKHGWGQDPPQHGQVLCPCKRQARKKIRVINNSAQHMFRVISNLTVILRTPQCQERSNCQQESEKWINSVWECRSGPCNFNLKHQWNHVFRMWLKQGQNVVQRHSYKIIIFLISIPIL